MSTTSTTEDQVVHSFIKNSKEEVRFTLGTFMGREVISIRIFVTNKDDQDVPTRKGITIGIDHLPELVAGVGALANAVEARGR